ncbi:MAG: hypothetical protein SPF22_00690 [Candidatus Onthovivens sp.]|nr:hypothetical protein [Candidatus Onthovivens sp.]
MATETWLLNETLPNVSQTIDTYINFTCNSILYDEIYIKSGSPLNYAFVAYRVKGGSLDTVYTGSSASPNGYYTNQAYRTITFATAPTGDLLTWLQANGTKQQPTYKFKHWKKSNVVVNRTLVGEKYYYFKPYTILGLYTITTTLTNCTGASANATKIQENGDLTLTFTANSGYELPTGVSVTNVTSYNWNKATGVLAISKPTGDVAIEIVAVSALPQLTTPTNVAVTDTTLTFDEVANATSYEVFVDNVSIGTVEQAVTEDELAGTWVFNDYVNIDTNFSYTLSFISNNIEFSRIVGQNLEGPSFKMISLFYAENAGLLTNVFNNESWASIAYKTIIITSKLSEVTNGSELLAWLQANGVKQ